MDQARFAFQARARGGPLSLQASLNNSIFFNQELTNSWLLIEHIFDDVDQLNQLKITMSGKLPEHTHIDINGAISLDRVIEIRDFSLDKVPLGHVFVEHASYCHDFNGTQEPTTEKFYGVMGCNGTVEFNFTGPVYLWLLEHM